MKTVISLATATAVLGAGAALATASGPITAPHPVAPDGASFGAYLQSHSDYASRQIAKGNTAVDRWWEVPERSRAERNQKRNHRRAVQNFRAAFTALERDTQALGGCQVELVANARMMLNALSERDKAMRQGNPVRPGRAERMAGIAMGNSEAAAIKAAICLLQQGWQFPDAPEAAL